MALTVLSFFAAMAATVPAERTGGTMDKPPQNPAGPWTLTSDDTEARIAVVGDRPVVEQLGIPGDTGNWLSQAVVVPLPERAMVAQTTSNLRWKFEHGSIDVQTGTLRLVFTNGAPALRYRQFFQARPGHGPVRQWAEMENLSGNAILIQPPACLAMTGLTPGGAAAVWWVNRGGNDARSQGGTFTKPVAKSLNQSLKVGPNGALPVPWLAVQAEAQRGLYIGWEYSGNGTMQVVAGGEGTTLDLRFLLAEAQLPIPAGQTLWLPPAFIGCYRGDVDDGSYCLHRFYLEKLRPPLPKDCPDPILTMNVFFNADKADGMMTHLKLAQELGFEAFVVDAVWFPGAWETHKGPWVWDLKRFPNGGQPFQEFCAKNRMRFGQWCAWGRNFEQAEALTQQIVADNKLDYFKHDMGLIPDGSYARTVGYYKVQEVLHQKFPNLILENCDAGGCIKDYGAMSRAHYIVTTDDLGSLADRMGIYDSTYALPPQVLQTYTWLQSGDKPGPFLWRSGMMGAWVIDTPPLPGETHSIRKATATYKNWIRPILRDCKVHHILPRPDGKRWDGIFYWGPKLKKGVVFIFRPQSDEGRQIIRLKGLDAKAKYWLWCEDGSITTQLTGGDELMQKGLSVNLPTTFSSDIIFIQDAADGKPADLVEPGAFSLLAAKPISKLFTVGSELGWTPSQNARKYRVSLADTAEFTNVVVTEWSVAPAVTVSPLPPRHKFYWRVEAITPGGTRTNDGGAGSFTTPDTFTCAGLTFASDLPWTKATAGSDTVHRDKNVKELPITINGKVYPKGLWTHAFNDATPADFAFDIAGKKFATFKATVGLDDLGEKGSVQFEVLVDGVKQAESPVMRPKQTHEIAVDVSQAKNVTLRVTNGGDGYQYDHAAWGFARFVEADAKDPVGNGE
jgi:hypothetical protein